MKGLTVVNIEKAIKEHELKNNVKLNLNVWELSQYIWNCLKDW